MMLNKYVDSEYDIVSYISIHVLLNSIVVCLFVCVYVCLFVWIVLKRWKNKNRIYN